MSAKKAYTAKGEYRTVEEAQENFQTLVAVAPEEADKWEIQYDGMRGVYEIVNKEEFEKYKKINDWQNDRHLKEVRKRTAVADIDDVKIMCEVLVNIHPEIYVDALKEYIRMSCQYLKTFEILSGEMVTNKELVCTGEES